jgi:hypothetical protein
MVENSHAARAMTHRSLRWLRIGGLSIVAALGLADRVNATYLHSDYSETPAYAGREGVSQTSDYDMRPLDFNTGDYIDRVWYYLLDDGQYYYLDEGQYNLMGGLSYLLGHPAYPKLFERDLDQAVGFTNRANAGWLSSAGGRLTIIEYPALYSYFNAGDYIDRARYYYLDKGQYYYLDRGQYNLLGGLGYLFGRSHFQTRSHWDSYQLEKSVGCPAPEPSTIGFLALGAFAVIAFRRRSHSFVEKQAPVR